MKNFRSNELELALKIAIKAIDRLLDEKPKGGLIMNKGQAIESKMSYQEAKLCMERIERMFGKQGAFSFGICGECTKWNTAGHDTAKWKDFGDCSALKKYTHRYDCCERHSKENGGWGL